MECGGETSESEVEGALAQHSTSHVPLGWVDGVLPPLPSVALRLTVCRLGSGNGTSSFSDEDAYESLPAEPSKWTVMFQIPE